MRHQHSLAGQETQSGDLEILAVETVAFHHLQKQHTLNKVWQI